MLRMILGVVAGFIAWSIIWVGGDQIMYWLSRDWYGGQKDKMTLALVNDEVFSPDTAVVVIDLVRSVIASIMAGFLAAVIAGENRRAPMILGVLLLVVGIAVQVQLWNLFPVWFHLSFWLLLIPMTILGGKMKQSSTGGKV